MIIVNVELWPYGAETGKQNIGKLFIANTLEVKDGKQVYSVARKRDDLYTDRAIEVTHDRADEIWHLVQVATDAVKTVGVEWWTKDRDAA